MGQELSGGGVTKCEGHLVGSGGRFTIPEHECEQGLSLAESFPPSQGLLGSLSFPEGQLCCWCAGTAICALAKEMIAELIPP